MYVIHGLCSNYCFLKGIISATFMTGEKSCSDLDSFCSKLKSSTDIISINNITCCYHWYSFTESFILEESYYFRNCNFESTLTYIILGKTSQVSSTKVSSSSSRIFEHYRIRYGPISFPFPHHKLYPSEIRENRY